MWCALSSVPCVCVRACVRAWGGAGATSQSGELNLPVAIEVHIKPNNLAVHVVNMWRFPSQIASSVILYNAEFGLRSGKTLGGNRYTCNLQGNPYILFSASI
jgi:hypothetical protein